MEEFLIIEDNELDYILLNEQLLKIGVVSKHSTQISSLKVLGQKAVKLNPGFIFCDLNIDDSRGIDTFIAVKNHFPAVPIVIMSGHEDKEIALAALHLGAEDYLKKAHYDLYLLEKTVRFAKERKQYKAELEILNLQLQKRASELISSNEKLRKIAWIQSHIVRAPLARILGFVELLKEGFDEPNEKEQFLNYIADASEELDTIIHSIVKKAITAESIAFETENMPCNYTADV